MKCLHSLLQDNNIAWPFKNVKNSRLIRQFCQYSLSFYFSEYIRLALTDFKKTSYLMRIVWLGLSQLYHKNCIVLCFFKTLKYTFFIAIVRSHRAAMFVLLVDILKARALWSRPDLEQSKPYLASLRFHEIRPFHFHEITFPWLTIRYT